MKGRQKGFTLVELIVVIVILGILAATALPRFINVQNEARSAAVQGIAGGLRGSIAAVQAKWYAAGGTGTSVTTADNSVITVTAAGLPINTTAAGIVMAMNCESTTACQGITVNTAVTPTTWRPTGGNATCEARYDSAATPPVTVDVSNCN